MMLEFHKYFLILELTGLKYSPVLVWNQRNLNKITEIEFQIWL